MREVERILILLNVVGAAYMGARHEPGWFALAILAFGLYVTVADRVLRRRIGDRAWPSEGYARFAFNTNLYFALKHLALGALLYGLAGSLPPL